MTELLMEIRSIRHAMQNASWENVKGAIEMMLRVYGSAPNNPNVQSDYDHLERCAKLFVRAVEESLELMIIDEDEDDDGQPTEAQEWRDFDKDC